MIALNIEAAAKASAWLDKMPTPGEAGHPGPRAAYIAGYLQGDIDAVTELRRTPADPGPRPVVAMTDPRRIDTENAQTIMGELVSCREQPTYAGTEPTTEWEIRPEGFAPAGGTVWLSSADGWMVEDRWPAPTALGAVVVPLAEASMKLDRDAPRAYVRLLDGLWAGVHPVSGVGELVHSVTISRLLGSGWREARP